MSRKKIKTGLKVKVLKPVNVTMRQILETECMNRRAKKRKKDTEQVEDMLADGTLDPEKITDYKYMRSIANNIEWSISRLNKAVNRSDLQEVLDNETKTNNKSPEFVHTTGTAES